MNTVQWWLNHVDEGELTNVFFTLYPIDYEMAGDSSRTIQQTKNHEKLRFLAFLLKLRVAEISPAETEYVFFAVRRYQVGEDMISTCLCRIEDLYSSDTPETLSWLLVDLGELLRYRIADTELTRQNILQVLCKILYVASFLGYSGKYRELYQQMLSSGELDTDNTPEEADTEDPELDAWRQEVWNAEQGYNDFCFQREVASVRNQIAREFWPDHTES